jgi:hypothetical protein
MRKTLNQTNNHWVDIARAFGMVLALGILVFVVIQFRSTWQGPIIEVRYPAPGQTIYDPVIIISGKTKNIAQLRVFGSPVPIQLKSNLFSTEVALPEGVSTITIDGYTRSGEHTRTNIPVLHTLLTKGSQLPPNLEIFQKYAPVETPFRPTSDLLEELEPL